MEINLVTSNLGKVKEFNAILGDEIKINHIEKEYKEMRSDDPEEITKDAAKRMAEELEKPVVVEDSGLFIEALNDFPGTCSSYIHKRIGLRGIIKLMKGIEDRTCHYRSAVGYCEPGKEPISFFGEEKGIVAEDIKGNYGFGHDPIFIPENSKETYGEMKNCENLKRFRKQAAEKLKKYLIKE